MLSPFHSIRFINLVIVTDLEDPMPTGKDVGTVVLRIKRVKFASVVPPNAIQQLPGTSKGRNGMRIGYVWCWCTREACLCI